MKETSKLSLEKQKELLELRLNRILNQAAKSSFDVQTVVDTFLKISIDFAYLMSSTHDTAEELIGSRVVDAKIEFPDNPEDITKFH